MMLREQDSRLLDEPSRKYVQAHIIVKFSIPEDVDYSSMNNLTLLEEVASCLEGFPKDINGIEIVFENAELVGAYSQRVICTNNKLP
jgi:hypothetical protein